MSHYWAVLLVALVGLGQAALGAVEELAVLYNGEGALPPNMVMGDWGSTIPRASDANPFKPENIEKRRRFYGLRIVTLGRYQGIRFDFLQPVDLSSALGAKNTFIELYLRAVPGEKGAESAPATTGPTPGAYPTTTPPEAPPGTPYGAEPGPWEETPGGRPPWAEEKRPTVPEPTLSNLRLTLFTEKGQGLLVAPASQFYPREEIAERWIRVDIPLSLLYQNLPVGGRVSRMLITSDLPAQFMLGRLAVMRDTDPLKVTTSVFPAFLEVGNRIYFIANVEAGLSRYETTWDFDTKAGVSVDAVGDRATYTYDAPGNYVVTCTVRDVTGGKEPVVSTIGVRVSGM